jgi:hypothetical protein
MAQGLLTKKVPLVQSELRSLLLVWMVASSKASLPGVTLPLIDPAWIPNASEHFCLRSIEAPLLSLNIALHISSNELVLGTAAIAGLEALAASHGKGLPGSTVTSASVGGPLTPETLPGQVPLQSPHSSTAGPLLG